MRGDPNSQCYYQPTARSRGAHCAIATPWHHQKYTFRNILKSACFKNTPLKNVHLKNALLKNTIQGVTISQLPDPEIISMKYFHNLAPQVFKIVFLSRVFIQSTTIWRCTLYIVQLAILVHFGTISVTFRGLVPLTSFLQKFFLTKSESAFLLKKRGSHS